jgi:precorrin-2 dehydrogenase/sirohydrochlorin ferrochelatase
MSTTCYPVALDLRNRRCLVVGSADLAVEKVQGLLRAGAEVTVVAETAPTEELTALAGAGHIALDCRPYQPDDVDGVFLAYGASEDQELNVRVAADGRAAGALVNAVDDIPNCDFYAVSIVRRGDLQVAVSTNGRSPALARWMREYLDSWLPHELGDLLSVLADVRTELKAKGPIPPYERWQAAIDDDVLLRLRHADLTGARRRIVAAIQGSS